MQIMKMMPRTVHKVYEYTDCSIEWVGYWACTGVAREKAKQVYDLLMDDARLAEERAKAEKLREKITSVGNETVDLAMGGRTYITATATTSGSGAGAGTAAATATHTEPESTWEPMDKAYLAIFPLSFLSLSRVPRTNEWQWMLQH